MACDIQSERAFGVGTEAEGFTRQVGAAVVSARQHDAVCDGQIALAVAQPAIAAGRVAFGEQARCDETALRPVTGAEWGYVPSAT
jgi:hypothetical protein